MDGSAPSCTPARNRTIFAFGRRYPGPRYVRVADLDLAAPPAIQGARTLPIRLRLSSAGFSCPRSAGASSSAMTITETRCVGCTRRCPWAGHTAALSDSWESASPLRCPASSSWSTLGRCKSWRTTQLTSSGRSEPSSYSACIRAKRCGSQPAGWKGRETCSSGRPSTSHLFERRPRRQLPGPDGGADHVLRDGLDRRAVRRVPEKFSIHHSMRSSTVWRPSAMAARSTPSRWSLGAPSRSPEVCLRLRTSAMRSYASVCWRP
jgi:hypothetical protein